MSTHDDNTPEPTADSPKTTNNSPSATPGNPLPVYRDMHLVEMTFVADDHHRESSEAAAARLPANTEPASEDVPAEQSFPRDEQLSNLFRAMLLQTSGPPCYTRALMQPRVCEASSTEATSIAETGSQEASGRVSHDTHLAEVRLRHVGARRQRVYKRQSEF